MTSDGEARTRPLLLTETEAADVLRLTVGMVRSLRRRGEISYVRIGRKVLYAEVDIVDFIERHTVRERPARPAANTRLTTQSRRQRAIAAEYERLLRRRNAKD